MDDGRYFLEALAAMGAATFLTRAFPFLVPKRHRKNPHLQFVGVYLPPAVMLLLVVYCVKDAGFGSPPYGLPELLCVGVVALLHLWRRNSLLSIGAGTVFYAFLVQTRVVERLLR